MTDLLPNQTKATIKRRLSAREKQNGPSCMRDETPEQAVKREDLWFRSSYNIKQLAAGSFIAHLGVWGGVPYLYFRSIQKWKATKAKTIAYQALSGLKGAETWTGSNGYLYVRVPVNPMMYAQIPLFPEET